MNQNTIKVVLSADDQASAKVRGFGRTVESVSAQSSKGLDLVRTTARAMGAVIATAITVDAVRRLVDLADSYTRVDGRIKLTTSSATELAVVQNELYAIAQRSRGEYLATADVYASFAGAVKGQNIAQRDLLVMTEALNKAFVVSGSSQSESYNSMVQLSQAFSSGVLRGDEFNSVMEQGGRVIDMLTAYTGKSRGELRKMAEDGQLTADVLRNAILSGAESVNAEFGRMPMTVGQAATQLGNSLGMLVADVNKASNAAGGLASAISGIATSIDKNLGNILSFFQNLGAIANPAFSGAELMAEAAAQGVDKLERVATSKVPAIRASMRELEEEIARVNASVDLRKARGADTNAEGERLRQLNYQLQQQKNTLKELTSSPYITGEAAGKLDVVAASWKGVGFQMQGVRKETAAEREISDKAHATTIKYIETKEQAIKREAAAAYSAARTQEERDAVLAKQEAELIALATQRGQAGESAAKKAAAAAKQHSDELRGLVEQYLPLNAAQQAAADAEAGLIEARKTGLIPTEEQLAEAIARVRDELDQQTESITEAKKKSEELADAYDKVSTALMSDSEQKIYALQKQNSELIKLGEMLEQDERYAGKLGATWRKDLGDKMAADIAAVNDEASQSSKLFEDMAKNIQSAFSGMFEDLLDGTGNMLDNLSTLFKKLLAQMATMAIAQPIIVPIITSMGGAMGVSQNTIANALGMNVSALSSSSGIGGLGGLSSLFSTSSTVGGSLGSMLTSLGTTFSLAEDSVVFSTANWLTNLGTLGNGLLAGAGSLLTSALTGNLNTSSLFQAGGAAIGSYFGPVGSVVGGLLGSLVGGLFGDDDENEFGLPNAAGLSSSFDKSNGLTPTSYYHPVYNETSVWYAPIANAYSEQIASIQTAFNEQVFAFAEQLPDEMQQQVLDNLAATNFTAILASASAGKWKVSDANSAISGAASAYSTGLIKALGKAYGSALEQFLAENGPGSLVGDEDVWSMLTDKVQQNITALYQAAAKAITGGDYDAGSQSIASVTSAIAAISSAIAPITEALDTNGLSAYELSIRSINTQFDAYADALEAAGVDLAKYTDLEQARTIALTNAADALASSIAQVMDPINEIIATNGMSDYEQALRSINEQFDGYRSSLDDLGAALTNYTTLEQARYLQLTAAADDYFDAITGKFDSALDKLNPTTASASTARVELAAILEQARSGDFSKISGLSDIATAITSADTSSYASLLDYQRSIWGSYAMVQEIERLAKAAIVPGYAEGGTHGGGWRWVGEAGPELEYTGPSRIVSNRDVSALIDTSDLRAEIQALRQTMERALFQIAKNTGKASEQLTRWEYTGLPAERAA